MRPPAREERGSATVYAVSLLAALLAVAAALAWAGGAVVAHRRAQAAADLAALAGASHPESGCAQADAVAGANGATLLECRAAGGHVWVTVEVIGPPLVGRIPHLAARAHAGPAP